MKKLRANGLARASGAAALSAVATASRPAVRIAAGGAHAPGRGFEPQPGPGAPARPARARWWKLALAAPASCRSRPRRSAAARALAQREADRHRFRGRSCVMRRSILDRPVARPAAGSRRAARSRTRAAAARSRSPGRAGSCLVLFTFGFGSRSRCRSSCRLAAGRDAPLAPGRRSGAAATGAALGIRARSRPSCSLWAAPRRRARARRGVERGVEVVDDGFVKNCGFLHSKASP